MASDETMATILSSMHFDDEEEDVDEDDDDQHSNRGSLSRLSVCTTNSKDILCGDDDDDDDDVTVQMSRLSVNDGSEVEADGEFSDGKESKEVSFGSVDDSDKESGWISLPAMPRRAIRRRGGPKVDVENKEIGSEGEVREQRMRRKEARRARERWLESVWGMRRNRRGGVDDEIESSSTNNHHHHSGESECVVIAKPKGGEKCLCMDMDEMKACEDLGFQLQRQWTLEIPHRFSGSAIDTDSGGNSPMGNWMISSPGDDPKDVKARLKVWAQVVASAVRLTN